jgi:hypothetical protein
VVLSSFELSAVKAAQRLYEEHRAMIESTTRIVQQAADQYAEAMRMHTEAAAVMADAIDMMKRQRAEQADLMRMAAMSGTAEIARQAKAAYTLMHELAHTQLDTFMAEVDVGLDMRARDRAFMRLETRRRYVSKRDTHRLPCRLRRNEGTHIPTYAVFWDEARLHLNPNEQLSGRAHETRRNASGCAS